MSRRCAAVASPMFEVNSVLQVTYGSLQHAAVQAQVAGLHNPSHSAIKGFHVARPHLRSCLEVREGMPSRTASWPMLSFTSQSWCTTTSPSCKHDSRNIW
jgi:hypothetical protein